MIDHNRWTGTLPVTNYRSSDKENNLDPNIWTNTIPKKKVNNSFKKFSLTLTLFVFGLILVSVIKNETRNLQREINNLQTTVNSLEADLYQTSLEYEVITSPENISLLAKKYLEYELVHYNRSQIKQLNGEDLKQLNGEGQILTRSNEIENKELSKKIRIKVAKKIEKTKTELKKLKALYKEPETIPAEMKTSVARAF